MITMALKALILVACLSVVLSVKDGDPWISYQKLMKSYQEDPVRRQQWKEHVEKYFPHAHDKIAAPLFDCDTTKSSYAVPTSVDKLTAGDIKVVAALGDSITAGFGVLAVTIIDVLINDRGNSHSIGGVASLDDGVITIPNILKKYNNDLYGYSTGSGNVDSAEAKFNVAVGGATAPNIPSQADDLVEKMEDDILVDMKDDWKMVTIFVGGNDLCRVCDDLEGLGSDAYLRNIESTLDKLAAGLPRTIVNVMSMFDVTPLTSLSEDIICDGVQAIACPCGAFEEEHDVVKREHAAYSAKIDTLIKSGKYDKEDFTVVHQPFLRDVLPPRDADGNSDTSYFSPDCFHLSEKGHKALARNLWNNLFIPVGQKPTNSSFKEQIQCPSPGAFIKTNKNSISSSKTDENTDEAGYNSDLCINVMAAAPESSVENNKIKSLTTGLAIVGSIGGLLLVAVAALMLIVIKRKRAAQTQTAPIQMS